MAKEYTLVVKAIVDDDVHDMPALLEEMAADADRTHASGEGVGMSLATANYSLDVTKARPYGRRTA